jgi:hypothetical protein
MFFKETLRKAVQIGLVPALVTAPFAYDSRAEYVGYQHEIPVDNISAVSEDRQEPDLGLGIGNAEESVLYPREELCSAEEEQSAQTYLVRVSEGMFENFCNKRGIDTKESGLAELGIVRLELSCEEVEELQEEDGVLFIEQDRGEAVEVREQLAQADEDFYVRWWQRITGVVDGQKIFAGDASTKVAILDSGIDPEGDGYYIDADRIGETRDFVGDGNGVADERGHGTKVASYYMRDDRRSTVMVGQVLNKDGWGYYSWWAEAIIWAVDNGAQVINLSASGENSSRTLSSAVQYAVDRGVAVCTSTGNDSSELNFPARFPPATAVGVSNSRDTDRQDLSNYGPNLDIVAPHFYTSYSAPQVTALHSLLMAQKPGRTSQEAWQIIINTAADINKPFYPGFDQYIGYGRIDSLEALRQGAETALRVYPVAGDVITEPLDIRISGSLSAFAEDPWLEIGTENGLTTTLQLEQVQRGDQVEWSITMPVTPTTDPLNIITVTAQVGPEGSPVLLEQGNTSFWTEKPERTFLPLVASPSK